MADTRPTYQVMRMESRGAEIPVGLLLHVTCESRPETALDRSDQEILNMPLGGDLAAAHKAIEACKAARAGAKGRPPSYVSEILFAGPPPYEPDPDDKNPREPWN